ncbi:hypothetical protein AMS68_003267 [Peltaster fructicola]|uniref:Uncharacterized protein n=1 Tax=Peltaster fructicola TaxID=286661 RepID=A0A6H0XTG7_9PEZI|nr:hypothetical protein AMS68_003267 [Peltaster fructicola]
MTTEEKLPQSDKTINGVPALAVQQAEAAAAAAAEDDDGTHWARTRVSMDSLRTSVYQDSINSDTTIPAAEDPLSEEQHDTSDVPPPAYGSEYGEIEQEQNGLETKAYVVEDGRIDISIDQHTKAIAELLGPALRHEREIAEEEEPPPPAYIPPSLGGIDGVPPPPMNVVIQVVGSRGDVQPFVALGLVLKQTYGHRVRLATHLTFKEFVTSNGLEFFNIGGDPAKLMAFMVKNPGLMPDMSAIESGDIGHRRDEVKEMLRGCWRSCYEAGDGTGPKETDASIRGWSSDPTTLSEDELNRPFIADAIIANPPSFAHIHVAEKLGIPLHIMFTMPYSPTQAFPHPLANIKSSNADPNITNYLSYSLVEMMTWQGLGDVINSFRSATLALDEITTWSHQILGRLKIPHTYCWSPALIPKPSDWRRHINIAGFYFLDTSTAYTPEADLKAFLDDGPPPVYIGFGSIVLDDPNAMTQLIFNAVRRSGQRALVSKGWGGMGADELGRPRDVFMLGNCPHDWLFQRVSCVVHHGGAGTTAAGIRAGRPTAIVPFFGDQPFWGAMVAKAGAGPEPIPHKQLTSQNLAAAIDFCLQPQSQERAQELADSLASEKGSDRGAQLFHQFLGTDDLRCSLAPSRTAVWRYKKTKIHLCALAACTLANAGILDFKDLKLFRPREYETDTGPVDPITGGAGAIIGTVGAVMGGVMNLPLDKYKQQQKRSQRKAGKAKAERSTSEAEAGTQTMDTTMQDVTQSRTASMNSGQSTPASSRSGSTFNVEESLARLGTPLNRTNTDSEKLGHTEAASRPKPSTRSSSSSVFDPKQHFETAASTGKGIFKIIEAGLKSPMDFTDGVARGFHNAPKLYGDDTVRKSAKVTGIRSGIKAASRGFGLGMYDGITGLVTQPMRGLQKEGAAGFISGIGKGVGGLVLKPGAAVFGIPSQVMKGIYREMHNVLGSSVQNYIIASRTAQGYEEWNASMPTERDDIIKRFLRLQRDAVSSPAAEPARQETLFEQPEANPMPGAWHQLETGTISGPVHQPLERSVSDTAVASTKPSVNNTAAASTDASIESLHLRHADTEEDDADLEEAIRLSSQEIHRAQSADDAEIRRAIQASMAEPRDEDMDRALGESMRSQSSGQRDALSHNRPQATRREPSLRSIGFMPPHTRSMQQREPPPAYEESTTPQGHRPDGKTTDERSEEQIVMDYVKKQSLLEQQHRQGRGDPAAGSSSSAVEDEELRKAIEASLKDSR